MTEKFKSAPDFELFDQYSIKHSLMQYRGKWLVIYFYPHDDTPDCQLEACKFRDESRLITQFGDAIVIGINKGSVKSHKRFSDKYNLNFPLLSDPLHIVTKQFGAWRATKLNKLINYPLATARNTYLINHEGQIVKEYLNVQPKDHVYEVINDLQQLQGITS